MTEEKGKKVIEILDDQEESSQREKGEKGAELGGTR